VSKRLASCLGTILAFAAAISIPSAALAADGELWEVTSQMNIPGMPAGMAGMGQAPQRVCNSKNPREDATRRPDMKDCKVTDLKETGPRVQMTMTCPQGKMVIDQTYNAARTEYKSTMKMTSKDGDMVINSTGRKLGTCDVQQARKEGEDKAAKMKSQGDAQIAAMNRQQAAQQKQQVASLTKSCTEAATSMDAAKFPSCYNPVDPLTKSAMCTDKQSFNSIVPPEAKTACDAKKTEFCQKLQTEAGFTLAASADRRSRGNGAEVCGLQKEKLQATLCGGALKNQSLDFLSRRCPAEVKQAGASLCPKAVQTEAYHYVARHCPADSKALFAKNCAGRDYTSMQDKKTRNMCTALARLDDDDGGSRPAPKAAAAEAKKPTATEQVQQGFGKGLDKLKGLFGR